MRHAARSFISRMGRHIIAQAAFAPAKTNLSSRRFQMATAAAYAKSMKPLERGKTPGSLKLQESSCVVLFSFSLLSAVQSQGC